MDKYQDIEVISQRTVYSGFLELVVTELRYRLFSGAWGPVVQRDCVKRPVAVGVLLYDPKREEVVLVEQFRMGALEDPDSPWLFEIVAGLVEEGEDYADVARRETQEESNCVIKILLPITTGVVEFVRKEVRQSWKAIVFPVAASRITNPSVFRVAR